MASSSGSPSAAPRSLEPGAWGLEPGAWGLGPGAWSLEPEAWGLEPEAWGLGFGSWGLEPRPEPSLPDLLHPLPLCGNQVPSNNTESPGLPT